MRVAVTGAAGKVGRYVVQDLLDHNYDVLSITHRERKDWISEQITLEVENYEQIYQALEGCDGVIHLAAIPSPRKHNDAQVLQTNVIGTYNVLLAAGKRGIKRIAIASSDCALGFTYSFNRPEPIYLPVDEEHPPKPDNSYGLSKIMMEKAADGLAQRFEGMSVASLRITYVASPEEYQSGTSFDEWTKSPKKGPWNLWSYIDARDVARAFRLSIETNLEGHEVFYISAKNTRCRIPTSQLIDEFYPNVRKNIAFTGNESLESSLKAEKLLKFTPEYSWDKLNE